MTVFAYLENKLSYRQTQHIILVTLLTLKPAIKGTIFVLSCNYFSGQYWTTYTSLVLIKLSLIHIFTFGNYIAKKRCEKAALMLKETALQIQEISAYVGYPDNNYFIKVFKKMYNTTPSEYRKSMLNDKLL